MNVKDAQSDAGFFNLEPSDITRRERQKREKYETTRTYTDDEKMGLVSQALETLYLDLPAIQVAGLTLLQKLTGDAVSVEFAVPDEPEADLHGYRADLTSSQGRQKLLSTQFEEFLQELKK